MSAITVIARGLPLKGRLVGTADSVATMVPVAPAPAELRTPTAGSHRRGTTDCTARNVPLTRSLSASLRGPQASVLLVALGGASQSPMCVTGAVISRGCAGENSETITP